LNCKIKCSFIILISNDDYNADLICFEIYKKSGFLLNETTIKTAIVKTFLDILLFSYKFTTKAHTPLITKSRMRDGSENPPDFIREIAAHSLTQLQRSGGCGMQKKP
jgi:hypothetical protein